ncbi:MAG: flagellar assembly protein T N-terminal domain-containing protein [Nitrospiraceae bacterium]|nr:flagellar assembly protein T N-terminal domain-containing protein [Nitrospiraceae bacterium]
MRMLSGRYVLVLVGIVAVTLMSGAPCRAGELVTADGFAAMSGGNKVIARDKAIDDALRKVVEQAVGTMVSSDTMTESYKVIHDRILAKSSGYVERYDIVSERPEGDIYRVTVRAEIGKGDLTNDLSALGLLHVMVEKPKVMVMIDERMDGLYDATGADGTGQAEATIIEKFINAGFNVVDADTVKANISRDKALRILEGDNKAAAAEGLKYGAQIVITGKAFSKSAIRHIRGTNMQSIQATIQARVIKTDTGKVIASKSETGAQAHIDEVQGGALALKEAGEKLSDELIDMIVKQWSGEVYGRSQEITVMISGLVSYRHLAAIKKRLEKETQGVKAVHQRSFTGGVAELMIDYGGKSTNIADELANRKFTGFRLEPTNVTPARIDLKAILAK